MLEKLVRRVSVRTRLLTAFLCVTIFPTVIIGMYAYQAYARSAAERLADSSVQSVRQLGAALAAELSRYSQLIDITSASPDVQEALASGEGGIVLRRAVSNMILPGSHFRGMRIADANGVIIHDDGQLRIKDDSFCRILNEAEAASPMDSLQYIEGSLSGSISIGRRIHRYPLGAEHIGYIFAFVDSKLINERVFTEASHLGDMILMSVDGVVLSGRGTEAGTVLCDAPFFEDFSEALSSGEECLTADWNGVASLIVFSPIPRYGAVLMAAIPLSCDAAGTRQVQNRLILTAAAAVVLCVALNMCIYNSVAAPIRRIIRNLSTPGSSPVQDTSPDELGFLARSVNKYTEDLKSMSQTHIEDQRRKRELELAALQYQINPHFLFNTLGTLKWLSVINDAPEVISDGISSLSQLLRGMLMSDDEMVTVREELDNLAHYLAILKIRYADSFEVVEEVDETALSCLIPRFVLQPLVENAVLHGSELEHRITITISCKRQDGLVVLEIRDDGCGFDLDVVNRNSHRKLSGLGISNVDERLRLCYGQEHALYIHSRPGEGTVCRVTIPEFGDRS